MLLDPMSYPSSTALLINARASRTASMNALELFRTGRDYIEISALLGRPVPSVESEIHRLRSAEKGDTAQQDHGVSPPPHCHRCRVKKLHCLQRAVLAVRQDDRGAGAAPYELPGIALEVDCRRTLAGCAGTGCTIILALQGNAEAFFLVSGHCSSTLGFGERSGAGHRSKGGGDSAGEDDGVDGGFDGHWVLPMVNGRSR